METMEKEGVTGRPRDKLKISLKRPILLKMDMLLFSSK
jgi:hypothetical protein